MADSAIDFPYTVCEWITLALACLMRGSCPTKGYMFKTMENEWQEGPPIVAPAMLHVHIASC